MRRRRFLTLAAAFACAPRLAGAAEWRGQAFGAEVSLSLTGPREETKAAIADLPRWLDALERLFSLYRPSTLTRLNREGTARVAPLFARLMAEADRAHSFSEGLFDPTVQPLWRALAEGRETGAAQQAIGWSRVHLAGDRVRLGEGQALTFNGIAQGFATDLLAERLSARGFTRALIDIGETRALGGPFRLSLADPEHGPQGTRTIDGSAVATSSPAALGLGTRHHILGPQGEAPLWSTVSIEAPSATLADALSTATVFMDKDRIARMKRAADLKSVTLVDAEGDLVTL